MDEQRYRELPERRQQGDLARKERRISMPNHNSGAETDKEAAPYKSTDDQSKTRDGVEYPYAPCSIFAVWKEKGVKLQLLPSPFRQESRHTDQAEGKTFSVHPDS